MIIDYLSFYDGNNVHSFFFYLFIIKKMGSTLEQSMKNEWVWWLKNMILKYSYYSVKSSQI